MGAIPRGFESLPLRQKDQSTSGFAPLVDFSFLPDLPVVETSHKRVLFGALNLICGIAVQQVNFYSILQCLVDVGMVMDHRGMPNLKKPKQGQPPHGTLSTTIQKSLAQFTSISYNEARDSKKAGREVSPHLTPLCRRDDLPHSRLLRRPHFIKYP